jgi:hypothetical protein
MALAYPQAQGLHSLGLRRHLTQEVQSLGFRTLHGISFSTLRICADVCSMVMFVASMSG